MKYTVTRTDGRDNSDEVYLIIRLDSKAKNRFVNIKTAFFFEKELQKVDTKQSCEISDFLDRYKEKGQ